jgi:hypothetical protein
MNGHHLVYKIYHFVNIYKIEIGETLYLNMEMASY